MSSMMVISQECSFRRLNTKSQCYLTDPADTIEKIYSYPQTDTNFTTNPPKMS